MCTISYVPLNLNKNHFVVTDSRDEFVGRRAIPPQLYSEMGTQLFYPKDTFAGGTWMGVGVNKHLICLMNGAFEKHQRQTYYRKSRGIVVKELLASKNIHKEIKEYNLEGIEQFFALIFSWNDTIKISEFVWDGSQRFINDIDSSQPKIWSASMTYDQEQKGNREQHFENLLSKTKNITSQEIWNFHHIQNFDTKEGIIIDRGLLKTTSISQYSRQNNAEYFHYQDLVSRVESDEKIIW